MKKRYARKRRPRERRPNTWLRTDSTNRVNSVDFLRFLFLVLAQVTLSHTTTTKLDLSMGDENPWYKAKEVIINDYHNNKITDSMDAKAVYAMEENKEIFMAVRWDRFRNNFNRLKNGGFKKTGRNTPNYWQIAKPILQDYFIRNVITDETTIDEIHAMEEFKQIEKDRLKNNFNKLKSRIKKDQGRAVAELAGYRKDMTSHTLAKDMEEEWHGSEAERLLRNDVDNGTHEKMKPKQLQKTRKEYEKFDPNVFRGHIYQEKRRKNDSNYWLVKKKKKEKKRLAKLQGTKYVDDDNDYYDPVLQFVSLNEWS